jgi:hypothetical protein
VPSADHGPDTVPAAGGGVALPALDQSIPPPPDAAGVLAGGLLSGEPPPPLQPGGLGLDILR